MKNIGFIGAQNFDWAHFFQEFFEILKRSRNILSFGGLNRMDGGWICGGTLRVISGNLGLHQSGAGISFLMFYHIHIDLQHTLDKVFCGFS